MFLQGMQMWIFRYDLMMCSVRVDVFRFLGKREGEIDTGIYIIEPTKNVDLTIHLSEPQF